MVMLSISLASFLLAVLKLPGLDRLRRVAIFFALGAGQIHLAVLALITYLFAENGYRLPRFVPLYSTVALFTGISLIVLVTLLSPVSGRMVSELVQLLVYAVVFMLIAVYLRDPDRFLPLLTEMTVAATLFALLGIIGNLSGITSSPHIYLGRGGNEGSFFLVVAGVVPAMTLFVATKRPVYILLAVLMTIAQVMALSRANMALSMLVIASPAFFLIGARWLRLLILIALIGMIFGSISLIQALFEQQQNYSTLHRIALYDAGWSLWQAKPWTGWGWGATSILAPQNTLTDDPFPHFHSTYIQFLVELGALGWLFISVWVAGAFWLILSAASFRSDPVGAFYIMLSNIVLLGSGFTEALLFGADRAVQVALVLALNGALLQHRRAGQEQARFRAAIPEGLSP